MVPSYENELAQIVADLNRAAQASRGTAETGNPGGASASFDQLLAQAVRSRASDVLLIAGAPVALRVNGVLSSVVGQPLTGEDTRAFLLPLMGPVQAQDLQDEGG